MGNKFDLSSVIGLIEGRDIRGLTRAISIVENDREGREELLNYSFRKKSNGCLTIGLTGAPGVGKSTLTNCIIKQYRAMGKTVGVLAVDPSSPYSGGAVLGDRIRMSEHNPDSGVFIRSIASRKAIGGLSEAAKYILYLFYAFGFDTIIVETLGVGQDETDVAKYVDITAVILVPGYGDTIQMAKAGIMEIADLFIVNKSDKPGADKTKQQLSNALYSSRGRIHVPIINTVAETEQGISEVVQAIQDIAASRSNMSEAKYRQRIAEEIRANVVSRIKKDIEKYIEEYVDLIR
ncbi:MAG: methylmalonyl Co-A mutase-associated GTPase MeaB, partial [Syntrophaceae bacterium]